METGKSLLAVRYQRDLKEFDDMAIALDFDRGEVRRRRQEVGARERNVLRRQAKLNRMRYMHEEQYEREIQERQSEIRSLKMRLKKTMSNLRHAKRELETENDESKMAYDAEQQTYLMRQMQMEVQRLKMQRDSLDDRMAAARRLLSEPVDDMRMDEAIAKNTEDDVRLAKCQAAAMPKAREADHIDGLVASLERLVERNAKRKARLMRQRAVLKEERRSVKIQDVRHAPLKGPKVTYIPKSSSMAKGKDLGSFMEGMFNAFMARQHKIHETERQTDAANESNKLQREKSKDDWDRKVQRVRELKQKSREKEHAKLMSQDQKDVNSHFQITLRELIRENERQKRMITRGNEIKRCSTKRTNSSWEIEQNMTTRRDQLMRKEEMLEERRGTMEVTEMNVRTQEMEYEAKIRSVESLEQRVLGLEDENNEKMSEIQEQFSCFEVSKLSSSLCQNASIIDVY